jgi:serine/threonine-protein kinase
MEFELGRTYSGYKFLDVVARSRSTVVYRVQNTLVQRLELLTALPAGARDDQDAAERLVREMRIRARLSHPHILTFYTALPLEGQLVMTTELFEGIPLSERLRLGPLPWKEAVEAIRQLLSAAGAGHDQHIVHRDINPSSILSGPNGTWKLTNYSLAFHMHNGHVLETGAMVGNPHYISPEQVKGAQDVDHRSDLYSLGAVLYEMLCGRPPFDSKSQFELMLAHVSQTPAPPSAVGAGVPKFLDAIVMKALAKEPAARFQSVAEFAEALAAPAVEPEPVVEPVVAATDEAPPASEPVVTAEVAPEPVAVAAPVAVAEAAPVVEPEPAAAAIVEPEPVVAAVAVEPGPVAVAVEAEPEPVVMAAVVEAEPVAVAVAVEPEAVMTAAVVEAEPVAVAVAVEPEPVVTAAMVEAAPVVAAVAVEQEPTPEPVSATAQLAAPEPAVGPMQAAALEIKPMECAEATEAIPVAAIEPVAQAEPAPTPVIAAQTIAPEPAVGPVQAVAVEPEPVVQAEPMIAAQCIALEPATEPLPAPEPEPVVVAQAPVVEPSAAQPAVAAQAAEPAPIREPEPVAVTAEPAPAKAAAASANGKLQANLWEAAAIVARAAVVEEPTPEPPPTSVPVRLTNAPAPVATPMPAPAAVATMAAPTPAAAPVPAPLPVVSAPAAAVAPAQENTNPNMPGGFIAAARGGFERAHWILFGGTAAFLGVIWAAIWFAGR